MHNPRLGSQIPIEKIHVQPFTIPTHTPEADGTLKWEKTTSVIARAIAGGRIGLGYTYADDAAASLAQSALAPEVIGKDAMDVESCSQAMLRRIRNLGRPGLCSMAISAVDCALWDLKARLLELPLCRLLGMARASVPLYGSGGFCNYTLAELQAQLAGWAEAGFTRVKMKVGREPQRDNERVRAARAAIGKQVELFVDANGAYGRKQALQLAYEFAASGVPWFEEPLSSDDLEGLRFVREHAPAQMEIAAGEYGYDVWYFRQMLESGAVDVLQADVTRCGGITGLLAVDALCQVHHAPLSLHTAPALHLHAACALRSLRHLEYFYDHYRIEQMLFDGVAEPGDGELRPALSEAGNGLRLKRHVAQQLAA